MENLKMADAHAKPHHDYHLVDPSPWPAVGSVSAFIMAVGAITWMHHMLAAAPYIFGAGVIGMAYTMIGWWRDVAREATHDGYHTRVVQISHRYGMILFIASEVMFFVAWFWAYFNSALFPLTCTRSRASSCSVECGRRRESRLSTPGTCRS
jgi:cytochrome c oxidase subunit 3